MSGTLSADLLHTKLYGPRLRPLLVPRAHLIARLNQGLAQGSKLSLISAPAGSGKTTVVSEWMGGAERPFAWLSLDEGDADLTRFLTYFIAALRTVEADMGARALALLQAPPLPPTESLLTALLNDLATSAQPITLVLDDYHVVDARPIDEALTFLIERLPPHLHLVLTTREDPNLPLARWRVRNQLTELRASDLRFSLAETAEFLRQVMGLNLSEANIATLESRTEGWIAGLQLAALSMQGHGDVSGFIRAFTGDNRYIVDYLVEEVLQRQPEPMRRFLLQTSILDRLSGPLCTAVTHQPDSKSQLETLERGNFFIIPLDDKRHWYRFHHLFADVLKVHLLAEQPELVATLHRRASEWYEQNGSAAEAIRHALAGEDFERVAGLVELAAPDMRQNRQETTLLSWLQALPEALIRSRPVLTIDYVSALLAYGDFEAAYPWLLSAEQWFDPTAQTPPGQKMIITNQDAFQRLPASIAMYRAGLALSVGNVADTVTYARRVLALALGEDHLSQGAAAAMLGLAFWTQGKIETAQQIYAEGMVHLQKAGNIADAVNGAITQGVLHLAQGRLRDARRTYERNLQLAAEQGGPALEVRAAVDLFPGLSELHYELNDLPTATQLLVKSKELGEFNGLRQNRYRWRIAMARIRQAEGDLDGALALLYEAEQLYMSDFSPDVRPIAALQARVWLAQGQLGKALSWAQQKGLSPDDDLSYLHEFEHITLARLLLGQATSQGTSREIQDVLTFLERLLEAAEAGGRMGSVLEILVVQALAYQRQGSLPAAVAALGRALALAEPEGYIRLFVDEGPNMATLLRETAVRNIAPAYTHQLLAAFGSPIAASPASPLIEPLSQRELELLRYFKTELSGPEIARELTIALSTVRTHTKSIFSKLNVTNRRAAVIRAEELKLI